MKTNKPFVEGLSLTELLSPQTETNVPIRKTFDFDTEILDREEGWVYEKLSENKKGKQLRKYYEEIYRGQDNGMTFWRPKIKDLAYCESKRWVAVQYQKRQYEKIVSAFQQVLDNTPFCCIRFTQEPPGYAWVIFPHDNFRGRDRGVSWNWWETSYEKKMNPEKPDRPDCQLRQDVGDAWFAYEDRSRQIRERKSYFEQLFKMALERRYADDFYHNTRYDNTIKKLVINGREYIIGSIERRKFGVIAYPEDIVTEIVQPGPRKEDQWTQ